jgi:hypothetical protein
VDAQGSEGEILRGAQRVLREEVLCAVVETWTVEVHRGQALTGEVMTLMASLGLTLFDIDIAAAWSRAVPDGLQLQGKRQIIGLDLLFLRDGPIAGPPTRILKVAALADLWGFPDVALEYLAGQNSRTAGVLRETIIKGASVPTARRRGLLNALANRRSRDEPAYPSLHP